MTAAAASFPAEKRCTGPAHAAPVLLPLDSRHWHFVRSGRRTGLPLSRCKRCQNWAKLHRKDGPHGTVPAETVHAYAVELLERVGSYGRVRTVYGINDSTLRPIVCHHSPHVQLRTVQRILDALNKQRRHDRFTGATSERFRRAQAARARAAMQADRQLGGIAT